jgi:hypothetical protein
MHASFHAVVLVVLASLVSVASVVADDELHAGDFVDRESLPGVTHEVLTHTWLEEGDDHLMQVRTTLEPGAVIPASVFSRVWSSTIESGTLTVVAVEGAFTDGRRGPRRLFESGSAFTADDTAVYRWANRGLLPVEVRSAVLFDQDQDPITRADDWVRFEDAFAGEVVDRIVLRGRNFVDEPYRIVVRDRSGRLVDAWMPSAAESDWAWAGTPNHDEIAFVAGGPYLRGTRLMVGFMSFPCGPDAIIDIGADLRAIRVIDRYTGGCDAAGEWHDVALLLRSREAIEAEEIVGQLVRPSSEREARESAG